MIREFNNRKDFVSAILEKFIKSYAETIKAKDIFHFVLAGGETPKQVYSEMAGLSIDWSKCIFWFGDERCLPENHPDLNSTMVKENLLNHISVKKDHIKEIQSNLGPIKSAEIYRQKLKEVSMFDFVLLGIGDDGHTASLFPGMEIGEAENSPDAIAIMNSPKLPHERVSISLNKLKKSKEIIFIVSGKEKKTVLIKMHTNISLPAAKLYNQSTKSEILYCNI